MQGFSLSGVMWLASHELVVMPLNMLYCVWHCQGVAEAAGCYLVVFSGPCTESVRC